MDQIINDLKEKLKAEPQYPEPKGRKASAVLIPLIQNSDGGIDVIFEQRSMNLKIQPGDICFPGGSMEENEKPEETALRETSEELLVSRGQLQIVGALDGVMSPSGMPCWPYVAFLHTYSDTFSKDEVERIIRIPLKWLQSDTPSTYTIKMVSQPSGDFPYEKIQNGRNYKFAERNRTIWLYEYQDIVIWGMTAEILEQFLRKIK